MSELCPRLMRATSATFSRITDVVVITSPPRLAFGARCIISRAALAQALVFPSQPSPRRSAMASLACPVQSRRLASSSSSGIILPSTHSVNSSRGGSSDGCADGRMQLQQPPFPTRTPIQLQMWRGYNRDSSDAAAASPSPLRQKGKYSRGLGIQRADPEPEPESRRDIIVQLKAPAGGRGATLTKYYATCAPGLEQVLAAELASPLIDAQEVEVGSAGVSFVGSKVTGYKATLWLRTAVRVLVQLAAGPLPSGRGQYDPVYIFIRDAVDWPSILVDDSSPPTVQQVSNSRSSGVPSCPGSLSFSSRCFDHRCWVLGFRVLPLCCSYRVSSFFPAEAYRPRRDTERRDNELHNARERYASRSSEGPRFRNFAVQSRVWNCTDISNSNFASVRAKDAICDAVRDACGGHRPEPPEQGSLADVPLFLSLYRDTAVLYRDLSGVSLHKRGYRDVMHKASLNEGIAAAVLTLAGWNQAVSGFGDANKNAPGKERVLLDPMCGSGTFLIEAALMASNTAPGLLRRQ